MRYFAGLAGRWLPLDTSSGFGEKLPDEYHELSAEVVGRIEIPDVSPICWCEVCGDLVSVEPDGTYRYGAAAGKGWSWSPTIAAPDLAATVGDHRHDDDLLAGQIRWYRLRAIGPWKDVHVGSIGSLLAAQPALNRGAFPVPSLAVVNDALAAGRRWNPSAGGIEFPPLQISPELWLQARVDLIAARPGMIDLPVPEHIATVAHYESWWDGVLAGFSPAARSHVRQLVFEIGMPMNAMDPESSEWHDALAKLHELEANLLVVLEAFDEA